MDLCDDGKQKTTIGISGLVPGKYYALYHNGELMQVRKSAGDGQSKILQLGSFGDAGIYTAVAFDKVIDGFPPSRGTVVKGKVTISPVPVLMRSDTVHAKSGIPLKIFPKADLEGSTFTWSSVVKGGSAAGNTKSGKNAITDVITVTGAQPAIIVYTITPHGPNHIVSCSGEPRDLIVKVNP